MYRRPITIIALLALCSAFCTGMPRGSSSPVRGGDLITPDTTGTYSRRILIGAFNSPKSIGPSLSIFTKDGMVHSFALLADLGGVATSTMSSPGWKFMWNVDNIELKGEISAEPLSYCIYAGHGVSLGQVYDFERTGKGWMGSMTLNAGIALLFDCRVAVCMDFSMEYGLTLTGEGRFRIAEPSKQDLCFYRNGIFRSYIPQIKILYCL